VSTQGKPWLLAIPYITNRAIQQRLDDVVGAGCWQNEYKPAPNGEGVLCGISILIADKWVTKWDGAENTQIESIKGGLSNSMKRAAVQWGIGRYLYQLEAQFANCRVCNGRSSAIANYDYIKPKSGAPVHCDWDDPILPVWAQPNLDISAYLQGIEESKNISELSKVFSDAKEALKAHNDIGAMAKVIEAKDKRKAFFENEALRNVSDNFEMVQTWLNKQIKTLSLIPNPSALQSVIRTIKDDLNAKCLGQHFDKKILIDQFNEAASQASQKLAA